jgi:uridine phosphorylase
VTGAYKGHRISVLSSGIGTDNMDIVLNELDALVNIDLQKRSDFEALTSLNLVRIGTCGALAADIPLLSTVSSAYAVGLEGLIYYYEHEFDVREKKIQKEISKDLRVHEDMPEPYVAGADKDLLYRLGPNLLKGITLTASGFYGPQGRQLRLSRSADLVGRVAGNAYQGYRVLNFEMETSALYALGGSLGHKCATVCTVVANRVNGSFAPDYHQAVDALIENTLEALTD